MESIDQIVDYEAEYRAAVQNAKVSGRKLTGLCPFHDDRSESFSADLVTGQWKCHAEGISGNFLNFWARTHGYGHGGTKQAYLDILKKYHRDTPPERPSNRKSTKFTSYSVDTYAFEKRLPADFLRDRFRLSTEKDRSGVEFLKIPYFQEDGSVKYFRKRYGGKKFLWSRGASGRIGFYGAWALPQIRPGGWVILVEGESDTQTLTYLGLPALGVAGANMIKPEMKMDLEGLKIYIHQEPDAGGAAFRNNVIEALRKTNFVGDVFVWSCQDCIGMKDPSDVYTAKGKDIAHDLIRKALDRAQKIDLDTPPINESLPDAPIDLVVPKGWMLTDDGIYQEDRRSGEMENVCRTPLLLTQRIQNVASLEEKIEVAYRRDGVWKTVIYPRSVIFDARGVRVLADLGVTVTSENSKAVVAFLGALEAANFETIPLREAASSFGWQPGPGRRFIPGHADNIVLDIDPSQRPLAAAYCKAGTLESWVEGMRPHLDRDIFLFILSAGFAAPLLEPLAQRIFFVYNWGGSRGGKTAALKAALSVWGDPEKLMVSFNSTVVGLERTAAFYCDLPLGIDERQLAGKNQESLDRIVYMISSGKGRIRGAKNGGLQATQEWRTVAIATGEEPIASRSSQTGVSTRALEIYGSPFDDEAAASRMHQLTATNYGHAGPIYVDTIRERGVEDLRKDFDDIRAYVDSVSDGQNGAHVACVSTVAQGGCYMLQKFFGYTEQQAQDRIRSMAANILKTQVEAGAQDVNDLAIQFAADWVWSNANSFGAHNVGQCYGFMNEAQDTVYIYPSILNQALEKEGFSVRKTMRAMADRSLVGVSEEKNGKRQYAVVKRFNGRVARFVEFYIGKLSVQEEDTGPEDGSLSDAWGRPVTHLPPLGDGDEPLPF